eukprot:3323921-Pleurochrysis_carterae.AAC.1
MRLAVADGVLEQECARRGIAFCRGGSAMMASSTRQKGLVELEESTRRGRWGEASRERRSSRVEQ